jgi:hypothetical protein
MMDGKAKYAVPLENVKQVKETTSIDELSDLIKSGWMLLEVAASKDGTVLYALGRVIDM